MECIDSVVQRLCKENRIDGAMNISRVWLISKDTKKTTDGRLKANREQIGVDEIE